MPLPTPQDTQQHTPKQAAQHVTKHEPKHASKHAAKNDELRKQVERQSRRMQQAEKDHPTLLSQTIYTGSLGLLFILPVVGGAYLGHWLDGMMEGYSMRWTLSLISLGIVVGAANVYLFVREH